MKMRNRYISMLLCIIMVLGLLPAQAFAADIVASGYCGGEGDGTNLTWTLDDKGVLTISGKGTMKDYSRSSASPWSTYKQSIKSVIVQSGVKNLSAFAFYHYGWTSLTSVTLADSVTKIGRYAFASCYNLSEVNMGDGITTISDSAFDYCSSLKSIIISKSCTYIASLAFAYASNLTEVFFCGNAPWVEPAKDLGGSFNSKKVVLFFDQKTSGWTDSSAYDAVAGTWNGYKLEVWNEGSESNNPTYGHFGKLDSYDANGSAVIDGAEYQFTGEFKNSSDNLAYLYGGNYLDNYVYAMFNLDTENRITALRWTTGTLCTLEGWDATNSIVDTSLTPILPIDGAELKAGDYRVSEITKASFPTDQIADWVGDDIRVYTNGQEIFKVIHVEHKTGVVTAFDPNSLPLTVYIDDVGYPIIENEGLVSMIRDPFDNNSEYIKNAEFTLYDGVLVELNYLNKALLKVSINNPGNLYYVGDVICVLASDCLDTVNGRELSKPENPQVRISDETLIELQSAITSLPGILSRVGEHLGLQDDTYICYVFKAVSPGVAAISISDDSLSGKTIDIPISISVDPHRGSRANEIDTYEWNWMGSHDEYNAIINGMVVSDFQYNELETGDYEFTFNVYNRSAMIGTVEVYNAAGEIIDIKMLDKASLPTDIGSTLVEVWNGLIVQGLSDGGVFSFRGCGSNKTSFVDNPIIVPAGGYIKITNSAGTSIPCLVLNSLDITMEVTSFLKDSIESAKEIPASSKKTVLDRFIETFLTKKGQKDIIEKVEEKALKNFSKNEIISLFTDISSIAYDVGDILLSAGTDTAVSKTIGVIQKTMEDTQYGSALSIAFAATGIANIIIQINQFCDSILSDVNMSIYTPNDRSAKELSSCNGVRLLSEEEFSPSAVLCVDKLNYDCISTSSSSSGNTTNQIAYHVSLWGEGEEITIGNASVLSLPMPDSGWETISLYAENTPNGTWVKTDHAVEGTQILAQVNQLGRFILLNGAAKLLTLDSKGGTGTPAVMLTDAYGMLASLPKPTREGYIFNGWYTDPVGGDLITTDTVFTADTTVYAHWVPIVASGTCGESIAWALTEKGLLCLLGSGEMYAYDEDANKAPWYEYRDAITSLRVDDGITSIGAYAFKDCAALADVDLCDSVATMGIFAFAGCTSLTELELPANINSIYSRCFLDCDHLQSFSLSPDNATYEIRDNVIFRKSDHALCLYAPGKTDTIYYVPEDVPSVTGWAFAGCKNLHAVVFPESFERLYVYAFENAVNLSRGYFMGNVPEIWRANAFAGTSSDLVVYYRDEADGWTDGIWTNPETQEVFHTKTWKPESGLVLASGLICEGTLQFDLLYLGDRIEDGEFTIFAALYDNGKFVSLQSVNAQVGENRITLQYQSTYTDCKLFAIDPESYHPLCASLAIHR